MTALRLIPCSNEAAAALAHLHAQGFADPWSAEAIARLLDTEGTFALAFDEPPIGFVMARVVADEAEILTIAVAPSHRRRSIGRQLIEAAARHAEAGGASQMFLEVGVSNEAARALYESLGFRKVGERKAYYRAAGQDAPQNALTLRARLPLGPLGKSPEPD